MKDKNQTNTGSGNAGQDLSLLRKLLSPLEFHVTKECGTEPAFQNRYWDNKKAGLYVDVISGEPLFSSIDKYDSGTGWPSFKKTLDDNKIELKKDGAYGMERVEVRSVSSDSHLGHVFDDGPGPLGLRFCMNSASLRFIPLEKLEDEGYGEYKELFEPIEATDSKHTEIAEFAAGCFWGVEAYFKRVKGVVSTQVGYSGGHHTSPTYRIVCEGDTGHAESVLVEYDPNVVSYEKLLMHFWRLHNPTTPNRQGNDVGTQYRSVIFTHNERQKKAALLSKQELTASGKYKDPIVTEIVAAADFYPAEGYHQDYLGKNPGGYCHVDLTHIPE